MKIHDGPTQFGNNSPLSFPSISNHEITKYVRKVELLQKKNSTKRKEITRSLGTPAQVRGNTFKDYVP